MKNNIKVESLKEHARFSTSWHIFMSFKVILLLYCRTSNEPSSGNYCPNKKKRDKIGKQQKIGLQLSILCRTPLNFSLYYPLCLGLSRKRETENESKNDTEIEAIWGRMGDQFEGINGAKTCLHFEGPFPEVSQMPNMLI